MSAHKTACILCSRNCGLDVETSGRRFVRIHGDKEHPVSKGYMCQKGARLGYYQDNADRLTHPLKRMPDGQFAQVSWDEALRDIATRLLAIRERHGGRAFAFYGGGGQGNHLGGAYGRQLQKAMRSRYLYNSLAQEKTGDFWANGRIFGRQTCHTTEDIEHADFALVIGANPWQAHGIPNARDTLRDIKKDPARTLVVIDPRRTETAKDADIHLQLRPGTDAYLMAAMLSVIVREGLHDKAFLAQHTNGFAALERALLAVPVEEYVRRADVSLEDVQRVARGFAKAERACVRVDLGIQQSPNTTLNGYLEKMLFLVTGQFGKRGGNNLHTFLLPVIGDTDERKPQYWRTARHGMHAISGIYPPNILPDEIEHTGEDRVRAMFVDSANPAVTAADSQAYARAFRKLELLVVVDVAFTETARLAHYVLPAASQFEKWECTGFNLEFPQNAFQLRAPLFEPLGECLPEPEIYTRLLEHMGELPKSFPVLRAVAEREPAAALHLGYLAALATTLAARPKLRPYAASLLYRTLGAALPDGAGTAAFLLPLAMGYAHQHYTAVKRAGYKGNRATLGVHLFRAILNQRSGAVLSRHEYDEVWSLLGHADQRAQLEVPEMLQALRELDTTESTSPAFPLVLMAGERRTYNANAIFRDPAWRKQDKDGALRIHPEDAQALELEDGVRARVTSARGAIEVTVQRDESVRRGMVTLPHGHGMRYGDSEPLGPALNQLTSSEHCEPFTRTPYHKHVPVRVEALAS
ncbi:MAG: molybdopterin-dependent oxidoreductase [Myxococcales bacterium]|nr:molybdopterin-dependent oxidoreductase [Myxococcales bacterium]MCB9629882.1 molybdopterin-dependent oxidoreductase [Sandaracinaceae bacterium]